MNPRFDVPLLLIFYSAILFIESISNIPVTDRWIQGIHESGPRLPREIPYIFSSFHPFVVTRT